MQKSAKARSAAAQITIELLSKAQAEDVDRIFPAIKTIWQNPKAVEEAVH
jgi:hypothetical protein